MGFLGLINLGLTKQFLSSHLINMGEPTGTGHYSRSKYSSQSSEIAHAYKFDPGKSMNTAPSMTVLRLFTKALF